MKIAKSVIDRECCEACYMAAGERCNCRCNGKYHGKYHVKEE